MTNLVTRFINLEDQMHDRPLACKPPAPDDYVPVNIDAWESSSGTIPLLEQRLSDGENGMLSCYSFSREAQACYLLSKTLDVTRRGMRSCDIHPITASLQDFLMRLMDPAVGTWGTFCGATSMTIRFVMISHANQ
jgi:hypothetical protein